MSSQFLENFKALRRCLIRSLLGFIVVVIALLPFTQELFLLAGAPLLRSLPQGTSLLAVGVISPVMGPLKVILFCAFALSLPWIFLQLWFFIAPALYRKEKRAIMLFVFSALCMFVAGTAYCYLVVFNFLFPFIVSFAPQSVNFAPDIDSYISFMLRMFLAFGVAFETPVGVCLLICFNLISIARLKSIRRYVIVGSFALAAVLTPPDVTSQLLLAIPLIALYELGLLVASVTFKRRHAACRALN